MKTIMPAIFIGHGSPMNAIEDNPFTKNLVKLGQELIRPKAILVISAHWTTSGTFVTAAAQPEQIYDFYGFPDELYQLKYPVTGDPRLAKRICDLFLDLSVNLSSDWGIDHGSWTILKYLFPKADIPTIQLSLDLNKIEIEHLEIAKKLNILREEGVLIIGSGNIVHNLGLISWEKADKSFDWAVEFDEKIKEYLLKNKPEFLGKYLDINPNTKQQAVPTNEHYLPMLYVAALRQPEEKILFIYEGFDYKSISMRSFIIF